MNIFLLSLNKIYIKTYLCLFSELKIELIIRYYSINIQSNTTMLQITFCQYLIYQIQQVKFGVGQQLGNNSY